MEKKYIDADKLKSILKERYNTYKIGQHSPFRSGKVETLRETIELIDSLQQEKQMPDSTQLIVEWEKEKAILEQKDFCDDAERMAYNAFLDGFVKGLGYEGTK